MTRQGQGARATSGRRWRARADGDGLRASEMGVGSRGRGQGARTMSGRRRRARADGDGLRASERGAGSRGRGLGHVRANGGRARAAWTAGSRAAALPAGVWGAEGGRIQGGGVASGFFQPKRAELGSKTFWAGA
jgi:hypothetical protein